MPEVRFTPQMYINYHIAQCGITLEEIGVAPIVVISWSPSVIQELAESIDAQPAPNWPLSQRYLFYTGQIRGQAVSFAQVGIGAPNTITAMENMIACGTRLFLGLGWAGSLQAQAPIGSLLIPTSCVREEGTSLPYLDDEQAIAPDSQLVEQLAQAALAQGQKALLGPQWTTDAPYRELCSKIEDYGQRGVLGVDMETSAMYALGVFCGVRVCNLLVVSDELWQEWNPAFSTPALKAATQRAQEIVLRVLADMELA